MACPCIALYLDSKVQYTTFSHSSTHTHTHTLGPLTTSLQSRWSVMTRIRVRNEKQVFDSHATHGLQDELITPSPLKMVSLTRICLNGFRILFTLLRNIFSCSTESLVNASINDINNSGSCSLVCCFPDFLSFYFLYFLSISKWLLTCLLHPGFIQIKTKIIA